MRRTIIAALLLSGCGSGNTPIPESGRSPLTPATDARWDLQSSGEGTALALLGPDGRTVVRLVCAAGDGQLLVNVQGFTPIASEERMTFGSGGSAATLVAGSQGDSQRGGVSGAGPVPNDLEQLIRGPISVNYGAQSSGPFTAPDPGQARDFAAACAPARPGTSTGGAPIPAPLTPAAGACRTQDGATISANALKAVGTEPFWAAMIDGRCVTYSHPENQTGTRIWTRFSGARESGLWTGFYEGGKFELRTRPEVGCSDGMSDRRYPIAVTVTVNGEQRQGCADAP